MRIRAETTGGPGAARILYRALGRVTHFTYTNGCLTQVTDALGHSSAAQCNAAGQPTAVQDALGNIVSFAYQGYDLQSVTDPLNRTTNFVVDTLGRRIATRDALGNVSLVHYDSNDRVVSATDALNQTTTQSYDGNGNLLSVTLPRISSRISTEFTSGVPFVKPLETGFSIENGEISSEPVVNIVGGESVFLGYGGQKYW